MIPLLTNQFSVLRIWYHNFVTQSIVQGELTRRTKVNAVDKSWKSHLFPVSYEVADKYV